MRIVSLIASGTEIICALGLEKHLVGRSHECDYPPSVLHLPVVTAARVDATRSSAEIHRQVMSAFDQSSRSPASSPQASAALSLYHVDAELLDALRPDVIVTQSQCEVCAVSLADVERAVCAMVHSRPRLVSLEPNALEEVWQDIARIGEATGAEPQAAQLVAALKDRMGQMAERVRTLPPVSVVCVEWIEPLMVAGNWVPQLVEAAGGRDLLGRPGKHAPWIEWDQFHEADPDVIVLMPCGFGLEKTMEESRRLFKHPGFWNYRAVRAGRLYAVDGNSYFNRPGPRLVESAEILAEIFHGEAARYGHEGRGWRRVLTGTK